MKIVKYYTNPFWSKNKRLICRVVNPQLETIKKFSGKYAETKAKKFIESLFQKGDFFNEKKIIINPYAKDAIERKVKRLDAKIDLSLFPNFHKSGSIVGMKNKFYGKGALLVRDGDYIYNVTSSPDIYFKYSI